MLNLRPFVLAAAFALTAAPALAEEAGGSDFFGALGDFVKSGISAPRTADDLEREEKVRAARPVEPPPAPVAAPTEQPAAPEPTRTVVAPPPPAAQPAPPEVTPSATVAAPAPAPAPVAPPPPARPKPVTLPAQPAPEPVSPSDRIAGTASLDQAVKLGGSRDFYGRALRRPAKD